MEGFVREGTMVEVQQYGKLRRFTDNQDVTKDSAVHVSVVGGDTIGDIVARISIPLQEVGSNVFLKGE